MEKLLDVHDLTTSFYTQDGVVQAVRGISFHVDRGETLGIVGESGCGKSVSMLSVLRLIPQPPGRIERGRALFRGTDLLAVSEAELRGIRGCSIAMVFQDPMTSLNPVLTIGTQIKEALVLHRGMTSRAALERVAELLHTVGMPRPKQRLGDYPHQLSGGMRQRAMIAMALSCNPALLIADEPTTALDVTIQAQILALVKKIQHDLGLSVIWITHDMGVVARLTKRVLVMYAGLIVEEAPVKQLFAQPRHPYTIGLLRSLPRLDEREDSAVQSIRGHPPNLLHPPSGCPFAARCDLVQERCTVEGPPLEWILPDHRVACWESDRTKL